MQTNKSNNERVHFACSTVFKGQLTEGADKLGMAISELSRAAIREYLNNHLNKKVINQK